MVLVDSSVWVNHLRRGETLLMELLENTSVAIHPFIIGELACGNLSKRGEFIGLLGALPQAPAATNDEALALIERRKLMGLGLGFIDVHLLSAALLHGDMSIWTYDKRLNASAADLGIAYQPLH